MPDIEGRNTADWLARHSHAHPHQVAVQVVGGESVSYAGLDRRADRLARWFHRMGLIPGDTVALLTGNDAWTIELWWAARRAGLYYVPLATRLRAHEIAYMVKDCGAKLVVVAPSLLPLAQAARAACGDTGPSLWAAPNPCADGWVEVDPRPAPCDIIPDVTGREIIYSSGTTGRPKGIRRALAPAAAACRIADYERRLRAACGLGADTVYLSVSPLYHATGRFLLRVIEGGGTVVLLPDFDPARALAALEEYRITHSQWVPTMFSRLLALPAAERQGRDLGSHRVALHAAAPCPIPVKRAMIDWWGPILHEYYGGSENAGVTFISTPEWLERPGSVGRSITGEIHILDEDGNGRELPAGEIGLICFEGGVPFSYINEAPESTAGPPDGLATYGDLGHVDEEGYLFISDRRTDLIIRGGVNIYPREVEQVLELHPDVAEVAVIGVPDAEYGQRVKAVIRATEPVHNPEQRAEELIAYCRERLASIKCPTSIDFVDALPRSENGKLLKRQLRESHGQSIR